MKKFFLFNLIVFLLSKNSYSLTEIKTDIISNQTYQTQKDSILNKNYNLGNITEDMKIHSGNIHSRYGNFALGNQNYDLEFVFSSHWNRAYGIDNEVRTGDNANFKLEGKNLKLSFADFNQKIDRAFLIYNTASYIDKATIDVKFKDRLSLNIDASIKYKVQPMQFIQKVLSVME